MKQIEEVEMAEALKAGDIVRLKSGGPNMTVSFVTVDGSQAARCHWFVDTIAKEASSHTFKLAELEKIA